MEHCRICGKEFAPGTTDTFNPVVCSRRHHEVGRRAFEKFDRQTRMHLVVAIFLLGFVVIHELRGEIGWWTVLIAFEATVLLLLGMWRWAKGAISLRYNPETDDVEVW